MDPLHFDPGPWNKKIPTCFLYFFFFFNQQYNTLKLSFFFIICELIIQYSCMYIKQNVNSFFKYYDILIVLVDFYVLLVSIPDSFRGFIMWIRIRIIQNEVDPGASGSTTLPLIVVLALNCPPLALQAFVYTSPDKTIQQ